MQFFNTGLELFLQKIPGVVPVAILLAMVTFVKTGFEVSSEIVLLFDMFFVISTFNKSTSENRNCKAPPTSAVLLLIITFSNVAKE